MMKRSTFLQWTLATALLAFTTQLPAAEPAAVTFVETGSFGGFTGGGGSVKLTPDGKLIEKSWDRAGATPKVTEHKVDAAEAAKLLTQAASLSEVSSNRPGNMTYILTIGTTSGTKTIKWSSAGEEIDQRVPELQKQLYALLRAASQK